MNKIILILLLTLSINIKAQELLVNGNLESATGWTVYNCWANHATVQFNYTGSKPADGKNGCLRVTASSNTNTLVWQRITLKGGKRYILDGAVKTNTVTSFFCEFYLSTIAPVDGVDYSPNSNGDVILGLSTWSGCGPNIDAMISLVACTGKRAFVCPGTAGSNVDVYFGVKTGSFSTTFMEVLVDEVKVSEADNSLLISSDDGNVNNATFQITDITPNINLEKFRAGLHAQPSATVNISGPSNVIISPANMDTYSLRDTMKVSVVGATTTSVYTVSFRSLFNDTLIYSTTLGVLDNDTNKITGVPINTRAIQLKSALTVAKSSTFKILNNFGSEVASNAIIGVGYKVQVTSENGSKGNYSIELDSNVIPTETYTDYSATISGLSNKIWDLYGKTEIKITKSANPFSGSIVNLNGLDVWLYFDSIKPQEIIDKYLSHILVNSNVATANSNLRVVQHNNGAVLISQPASFKPLTVYSLDSLKGTSMDLGLYTYYGASGLGTFNDNIRSFRLKKGYMATFAMDEAGTGYSKVYVAADNDIVVNILPNGLNGRISYARVIPWRWVTKKGWCGGSKTAAGSLNCSWHYDWDNVATSSNNIEYIPMRHNKNWNAYSNIDNKQNSTHALGFNEPDRPDQANMTTAELLAAWPNLLKSGLRLGSPCPSDGGLNQLYAFIDSCDKFNYRVDFVAMHWYLGCQTARQYYDRLKSIYDRTKRPIWITEWNNGANWTTGCADPTYEEQAIKIGQFLYMLDTTSFVERYAIYEWVEECRQMYYSGSNIMTPAGEVYRDKVSPAAFNPARVYNAPYVTMALPPVNPRPAANALNVGIDTVLYWDNGSPEVPVTNYKIYFGTSSPPPLVTTTTEAKYDPGTLLPNKVYFWKIGAVTASGEKVSSQWAFLTKNSVGVSNITSSEFMVYPNPASEIITISGLDKELAAEIYNNLGEKVFSGPIKQHIHIGHLPKGVYVIKIKGFKSQRFIKG